MLIRAAVYQAVRAECASRQRNFEKNINGKGKEVETSDTRFAFTQLQCCHDHGGALHLQPVFFTNPASYMVIKLLVSSEALFRVTGK